MVKILRCLIHPVTTLVLDSCGTHTISKGNCKFVCKKYSRSIEVFSVLKMRNYSVLSPWDSVKRKWAIFFWNKFISNCWMRFSANVQRAEFHLEWDEDRSYSLYQENSHPAWFLRPQRSNSGAFTPDDTHALHWACPVVIIVRSIISLEAVTKMSTNPASCVYSFRKT